MTKPRPVLRGVVFDMEGTLTIPNLDVELMYKRAGVERGQDILSEVARMPPKKAAKANAIIEEMEEEGRKSLMLMPGTLELRRWLAVHKIPTALVTRNTKRTTERLEQLIVEKDSTLPTFDIIIARDSHPNISPKPNPATLEHIAKAWRMPLDPSICMVVGSPKNDVAFGKAAGLSTALVDTGRRFVDVNEAATNDDDDATGGADICVDNLIALARQIYLTFDIGGMLGTYEPFKRYPIPKPGLAAGKAAVNGDVALLESLDMEDLLRKDDTGNTPLIWASNAGQEDVVMLILNRAHALNDARDALNAQGYLGATAIMRAARNGHTNVVSYLIEAKVDLDIPNNKLQYPLHFAAFFQKPEVVRLLLDAGANTRVLDRKGRTPAEDTKNPTIRAMIRDRTYSGQDTCGGRL